MNQGIHLGCGERFLRVQSFVHSDDELRERLQPGKPRVVGQELEKMVRRLNLANGFFVTHPLRVHQRLVQFEQGMTQFCQALMDTFRFRCGCGFLFHQWFVRAPVSGLFE